MTDSLHNLGFGLLQVGAFAADQAARREREEARDKVVHIRKPSEFRPGARRILDRQRPIESATLCGAPCGGRDIGGRRPTEDAARHLEGRSASAADMCPACMAAAGLAHPTGPRLPERRGSITVKQRNYLRVLLREAFVHRYGIVGLDAHRLDSLSMKGASDYINRLVEAKRQGWK